MKNSIAVIGNINTILIFKAVGFDCLGVDNPDHARKILNKAITEYKLIYITDEFAKDVEDILEEQNFLAYPVITIIPSGTKENDYALKRINQSVEKALGVNILLEK